MKVLIYGAGVIGTVYYRDVIGEGKRLNVEMLVLVGLEPYFLVSDPLVPERKTL
jgi:hypothetical protein